MVVMSTVSEHDEDAMLHSRMDTSPFFEEDGMTRKTVQFGCSTSSTSGNEITQVSTSTSTSAPVRRDEPHILKEGMLLKRSRRMPRRWLQRIVRLILSADGSYSFLEYSTANSETEVDMGRWRNDKVSASASPTLKKYRYDMRKIKSAIAAGGSVIQVRLNGNTHPLSRNDIFYSHMNSNNGNNNSHTNNMIMEEHSYSERDSNESERDDVFFLRASSAEDAADWAREMTEVIMYLTELDRDKEKKQQQSTATTSTNGNENGSNQVTIGDKVVDEDKSSSRSAILLPRMPELISSNASAGNVAQVSTSHSNHHSLSQAGSILIESGRLFRELSADIHRQLRHIFSQFTRFGAGQSVDPRSATIRTIDGARFAKLCRDARILDARVTTVSVDIVFAKVKSKGTRRISYEQFVDAISLLAFEKEMQPMELVDMILESHGPTKTKTTDAESVRLHDDKSTYTGVYARGGPEANIDIHSPALFWDKLRNKRLEKRGESIINDNIIALYNSLNYNSMKRPDTAPAASSGMKDLNLLSRRLTFDDESMQELIGYESSNTMADFGMGASMTFPEFNPMSQGLRLKETLPNDDVVALREVFWSFNLFGADRQHKQKWEQKRQRRGHVFSTDIAKTANDDKIEAMDGARFAKLFRDCGLLVQGELDATQTDIIFSRVCTVAARGDQRINLYNANTKKRIRKLSFDLFLGALSVAAEFRNADPHVMIAELLAIGRVGPYKNEVTPVNYVALHDNKNTYTGVYAQGGPVVLDKKFTLSQLVSREPSFKAEMRCAEDS